MTGGDEAYCIRCRRMVPAHKSAKWPGVFVLETHWRFSAYAEDCTARCPSTVSASPLTHGMEDPRAAFREARRAWGKRTARREMGDVIYVD
jgi:hypothetical protein